MAGKRLLVKRGAQVLMSPVAAEAMARDLAEVIARHAAAVDAETALQAALQPVMRAFAAHRVAEERAVEWGAALLTLIELRLAELAGLRKAG